MVDSIADISVIQQMSDKIRLPEKFNEAHKYCPGQDKQQGIRARYKGLSRHKL